jgi:antitoxin ParD1/3/4
MTIQLSPEQQRWLEAQVAAGHFASLEQAVAVAVADLMAAAPDDLDWAKPLVDEAANELDRGEGVPAMRPLP